ncbi:ABC transporter permease [Clostridium gasigenes]|nr:FtsX-like permease family protein [Clostridium gasigenes]
MARDFLKNKLAFGSVLLMSALCLATFSGLTGVWTGMQSMRSQYLEDTGNTTSDYIISVSELTSELESEIGKSSMFTNVERREIISGTMPKYQDKSDNNSRITSNLKIYVIDDNGIRNPKLVAENDWGGEGIWLDNDFYKDNNLNADDSINIKYLNGKESEVTVSGSIMVPENIMFLPTPFDVKVNHQNYAYAFCTRSFAEKNLSSLYSQKQIVLSTKNEVSEDQLMDELTKNLGRDRIQTVQSLDNTVGLRGYEDKIKQVKVYSIFFPLLFLIISIITLQSTMKRLVLDQRNIIGTLSAIGVSEKAIIVHYLLYGLICSGLGAIIGVVIGPKVISPALMNTLKSQFSMPAWTVGFGVLVILVAILLTLLSMFFIYTECKRLFKESPASIIKNKSSEIKKMNLLEKMIDVKWIPYNIKWILRDIFRNASRSIMAIFGAMGFVILLITGLGLYNSINYSFDKTYNEDYVYCHKLLVSPNTTSEDKNSIESNVKSSNPVWLEQSVIKIYDKNNVLKNTTLSMISDDSAIKLEGTDKKYINLRNLKSNEVVLSKKLANELSVQVGDRITFRTNSSTKKQENIHVVGLTNLSFPQGIFTNEKFYVENKKESDFATFLLTGELPDDVYEKITENSKILKDYQKNDQYLESKDILKSIITIIYLLVMIAMLLGICILVNYNLLIFSNRYREFATLKVIGLLDKDITFLSFISNAILTIIGCILGIPFGTLLLQFYVNVASPSNQEYLCHFNVLDITVVIGAAILISFVINIILNIKINKINMVESLKSIE